MKVKVNRITTTEATTTKISLNAEELKVLLKEMKQQEKNSCNCNKAATQAPTEKPVANTNNKANTTTQAAPTPAQTQATTPTEKPATPVAKATKEIGDDKPKAVQHTGTDPQAPSIDDEENLLEIPGELINVLREIGVVELTTNGFEIIHMYEHKILSEVIYGDTKDKALFDTIVSFENHGISVDDVCNGVYDYYRNGSVISKHKIESGFRLSGIEAMFNTEYKKRGGEGYVHLTDTYRGKMYVTYPVK